MLVTASCGLKISKNGDVDNVLTTQIRYTLHLNHEMEIEKIVRFRIKDGKPRFLSGWTATGFSEVSRVFTNKVMRNCVFCETDSSLKTVDEPMLHVPFINVNNKVAVWRLEYERFEMDQDFYRKVKEEVRFSRMRSEDIEAFFEVMM